MRKGLLCVSLISGAILFSICLQAQTDRFAYAITDVQDKNSQWNYLRKLDLQTGEYSNVLLEGHNTSFLAYSATTRKQFTEPVLDARYGNLGNAAFGTGVAAMAYDRRNNRLYYTPMFVDQLRYIDLRTMKVFYVNDVPFTNMPVKNSDQGNIVTRMVIASDGNGYALTNDGMHLIRFSTGKKLQIENLGRLVDDPANKTVSVHNSCSSFGGDMIADDNGNLYVISARNHVFRVNLESKVATHLGKITGLPENFTINGAAVNEQNRIVVASAIEAQSYFTVDPSSWVAKAFNIVGKVWHSSDLANSNLLATNKQTSPIELITSQQVIRGSNNIQLYPNPVTTNKFFMQFSQLPEGSYTIRLTDVMGRQVLQQEVIITSESQVQPIHLERAAAKGVYLVKVADQNSKNIFSTKLVVQ